MRIFPETAFGYINQLSHPEASNFVLVVKASEGSPIAGEKALPKVADSSDFESPNFESLLFSRFSLKIIKIQFKLLNLSKPLYSPEKTNTHESR